MAKTPASVWRNPIHFIAFGFGSGAAPKAPGTFGTIAGLVIWLVLLSHLPEPIYLLLIVASFLLGIWLCQRTSDDLGVHDHGGIVWDEFVGLWIALISIPSGYLWILSAFLLFRFFDIVKPWPVGWADRRVSGGLGIMLDDLIAGVMALLVIQVLARLI